MQAVIIKPTKNRGGEMKEVDSHVAKANDGFYSCGVATVNSWSWSIPKNEEEALEILSKFDNYHFEPYKTQGSGFGKVPIMMACLSETQVKIWEKYLLKAGWKIVVDSIPNTYHSPVNSQVTLYIKINHTATPEKFLKV